MKLKPPAQAERPEDDPDVRGGGRAAEDARIVKGADYASDDEEPLRNEDNVRLVLMQDSDKTQTEAPRVENPVVLPLLLWLRLQ